MKEEKRSNFTCCFCTITMCGGFVCLFVCFRGHNLCWHRVK